MFNKKEFWMINRGKESANNLAMERHFFGGETLPDLARETGIGLTVLHNAKKRFLAHYSNVNKKIRVINE